MNEQTYREHLNDLQVEIEELRAKLKASQTGDLISRQAAIDAIEVYFNGLPVAVHTDMIAMIHRLPSAQPEIIRCKDCVWWKDEDCTNPVGMFLPDEDDYCSCATRRREDG